MKIKWVSFLGGVAIVTVIMLGVNPSSVAAPPTDEVKIPTAPVGTPQYYFLDLPAGANLISSPLNSGQELARNAFLGLPPHWPLFWGWDSSIQNYLAADQAPMRFGAGYWVFSPVPTTLVVAGQPYGYFDWLTKHIEPGWHLFGVPFTNGIDWHDFRLYASGNPIGLQTAIELGWIESSVISLRGSEWLYHEPGQPFHPGWGYWVKTSVPLDVRAERRVGPLSEKTLPLQQQQAAGGGSTTTEMGWIAAVGEALVDVGKGAKEIAEGHWGEAGFEFLSGGFGLIEHGVEEGINEAQPSSSTRSTPSWIH